MLPVVMSCAPLILIDAFFKTKLWNNMESWFAAAYVAVLTALLVARMSQLHSDPFVILIEATIGAIGAGDVLMHTTMHRLNNSHQLAEPTDPQLRTRFSLQAMMIAVLAVGAYVTGWVLIHGEPPVARDSSDVEIER